MANSYTFAFFSLGLSRQRLYLVSRKSFLSCNYSSPFSSLFFAFVSVAGSNYFSAPVFSLSPTFTSFKEFSLHLQSVNLHFLSFLPDVENRLFSFNILLITAMFLKDMLRTAPRKSNKTSPPLPMNF